MRVIKKIPIPGIIRGQKIDEAKQELAKKFRREMTNAESILWSNLRRNQLDGFHFRRQKIIHGFIADFYCHAVSLVIEVDGDIHYQQKSMIWNVKRFFAD